MFPTMPKSLRMFREELVVVINYALQILHTLPHRLHGLETFVDRCVEIRDGVMASRTTHWVQPERVVIARVSAVIVAVVATTIVVAAVVAVIATAVGAFGSLVLGLLIPNVKIVIISSGGRPRARAAMSE
jgi:hypothetical protein